MEPSRSRTSPDTAAEDLSGSDSKQPVYSELDAKSDLGKKPSQWMQSPASISKIMHNVWQLSRKKDVVCLILSYPPFNSWNNERHRGWILDVLEIIHKGSLLRCVSGGLQGIQHLRRQCWICVLMIL
eukprot:XP_010657954.1 PREDICTED: uncharacterized protein LOC104881041 isoform X2 [Vitis vinifera]